MLTACCGMIGENAAATRSEVFDATIAPVLKEYCVTCHDGVQAGTDLALNELTADMSRHGETWMRVRSQVANGLMPPQGHPRPSPNQRRALMEWITAEMRNLQLAARAANGRAQARRLNRDEYVNSIRDLLGINLDVAMFPTENVASGFDNVDSALDLSPQLLNRYLEAADVVLDHLLSPRLPHEPVVSRLDLANIATHQTERGDAARFGMNCVVRDGDVLFLTGNTSIQLQEIRAATSGRYRVRISANAEQRKEGITFIVYAGNYGLPSPTSRLIGAFDVAARPTVVDFFLQMDAKDCLRIAPYGLPTVWTALPADYVGPGLAVQWIEIEGPLEDEALGRAKNRLLGNISLETATAADAKVLIKRFVPRAFRRAVTEAELEVFLNLFSNQLTSIRDVRTTEKVRMALRVVLKAVLCSPEFLFLSNPPGRLDDFSLATRLSYFLWSSTPDDTLLALAAQGKLSNREILHQQVDRMLRDRKSRALSENFTGQWLSLRDIKATTPDARLYPEFDELLEFSMPRETIYFFEEVMNTDRSALDFVDSDWSMLNERLASHYGISGVHGSRFRRVLLPPGSHRGGVMTQAAVLKVTANGASTSPVRRGAWVLSRILGDSLPQPPRNVPAVEPDTRGATTLREQLAKHRDMDSCALCHTRIDPPGNALEHFDVIGTWRQWYRINNKDAPKWERVMLSTGATTMFARGPDVDGSGELFSGHAFRDSDGLKQVILQEPDRFPRCLVEHLLTYATGHRIEIADREHVEQILADVRPKHYGLRSIIHAIVEHPIFTNK